MGKPLISIITPSLNRAVFLRAAVESVLAQGHSDVEHIIIDGGSTDGTLQMLRGYPHLRVLSEPDEGMYDAINKGLRMAQGEIIGLLNSDDLYAPGCFTAVGKTFNEHPDVQAVAGGAEVFSDAGGRQQRVRSVSAIQLHEFWFRAAEASIIPNAWFFRREVFLRCGVFDTGFRYAADREFILRIGLAGIRPEPIAGTVYLYRQHEGSATINPLDSRLPARGLFRIQVLKESIEILDRYLRIGKLPADARRHLKKANRQACYKLGATALYHKELKTAVIALRQGWRHDLVWPVYFIIASLARLGRDFLHSGKG